MPRSLFARKGDSRDNRNGPQRCVNTDEGLTYSLDLTKELAVANSTPPPRRKALTNSMRREVALREGAVPGESTPAACRICGAPGRISWPRTRSGRPGGWVTLYLLEFDHVVPLVLGGPHAVENIALACRSCNRSSGARYSRGERI